MTRVRYSEHTNGNLITKPILAGRRHVVVQIIKLLDADGKGFGFQYLIIGQDTGCCLYHGIEKTMAKAKAFAKWSLRTLGVNFDDEVRQRSGKTG